MDKIFSSMNLFLALGELENKDKTLKERVAYKERIVFATMRTLIPDWEKPGDWDRISDESKLARLHKLEQVTIK